MPRVCTQIVIAIAALTALAAPPAMAETTTLVSDRDNTLYEVKDGHLSNGAGHWLFAGKTFTSFKRRGLLHFDLSSIPSNAVITSATLTLYHSLGQPVTSEIGLHRVLADWGEGASDPEGNEGAGIDAAAGDATWLHTFFDTALWANTGGDFEGAASATSLVGPDLGFYSWSGAGLAANVQQWVAGALPNHGWLLLGDELAKFGTAKRFSTHENRVVEERPTLVVEWTTPAPDPDLNDDGVVNAADLAILLGAWDQAGATDLDGDGSTGASDLAILLGAWSV